MANSVQTSFVRVWYWSSQGFSFNSDRETKIAYSPGHVAIELHSGGNEDCVISYASYWPGPCRLINVCTKSTSHFHENLTTDELIETKKGKSFDLHDLNVKKIQEAINKYKRLGIFSWGILGSSVFRKSYERNCAGLSLYLLEIGGIRNLIHNQSTGSRLKKWFSHSFSVIALSGTSAWSYYQIRNLSGSLQNYHHFAHSYQLASKGASSAFRSVMKMFFSALPILTDTLENQEAHRVIHTDIQTILQKLRRSMVELGTAIYSNEEHFLPDLLTTVDQANKRFFFASITALTPVAMAISVLILNHTILIKTVTPANVKEIVEKAVKKEKDTKGR